MKNSRPSRQDAFYLVWEGELCENYVNCRYEVRVSPTRARARQNESQKKPKSEVNVLKSINLKGKEAMKKGTFCDACP